MPARSQELDEWHGICTWLLQFGALGAIDIVDCETERSDPMNIQIGASRRVALAAIGLALAALCAAPQVRGGFYTWQGTSPDWHTATNWDPSTGTPTAGDTAAFVGIGSAAVDVGAGATAERLNFNLPGGTNYTIDGAGPLTIGSFGPGVIWHRTGSHTLAAQLVSAQPLAGSVEAGRLSLSNPANTIGGTWTVDGGTLSAAGQAAGSGLGATDVSLGGGTLELAAAPPTVVPGLFGRYYNADADNSSKFPRGGTFGGNGLLDFHTYANITDLIRSKLGAPDATHQLDRALDFPAGGGSNSTNGNPFSSIGVNVGNNDIMAFWSGTLHVGPADAGVTDFRTASDDGTVIYIDGNKVVDNNKFQGVTPRGGSYNLTPGDHDILIGFYEGGGGAGLTAHWTPLSTGSEVYIDGSDPRFFTNLYDPASLSNDVDVTADSTIRVGPDLPSATLGDLTMGADTQLAVHSADGFQPLEFTGTATLSGGTATFNTTGWPSLTLNDVGETAPSNLALAGDGVLVLPTANTYTGWTEVQPGATLEVQADGALGTAGQGTTVHGGGSLRIAGAVNYATAEPLTIAGDGNSLSPGALHSDGGNNDYRGPITLGGDAEIRNTANRLRLYGVIDKNGHDLTFQADANIEVHQDIVGPADVIKRGNATLIMMNGANNTYDGATIIADGELDARGNDSLGTAAGGTTVQGGATLTVRDGRTLADDISIAGNGHNNRGALRSENNSNTLTGQVSLAGNSRIHVNHTQLTLGGQVTGGGNIEKTGGGRLILENPANDFTGELTINQGEVRATSQAALGSTGAGIEVQGGALALDGAWDLDAKHVSLGPGSTLRSLNGDSAVAVGLPVLGDATFDSATAGHTLSLDGPVDLNPFADLTFSGAGDTAVNTPIGNGGVPMDYSALSHYGYHENPQAPMDLHNNGGLMGGGDPTTRPSFYGYALLTEGPGGRGLDFNNDGDFRNTGAIGRNDHYMNLFLGTLHVDAANAGDWQFRNAGDDDRGGIWIDLDQDGIFQAPGGFRSGENISWEDGGTKTLSLAAGDYMVAFTHGEYTGGSRCDFRFRSPTMGGQRVVKPADPAQLSLWTTEVTPDNGLTKTGSGTLTLSAANTYNGVTDIQGGTLVAAHDSALGTPDAGTVVGDGATLVLHGGVAIGPEPLTLGDKAGTGTLVNQSGGNSYGGDVTLGGSTATVEAQADTLTLEGDIDMALSNLTVTGPGDTVIEGVISGTNTSTGFYDPGLLGGHQSGDMDTGPNSGNLGMVLGPFGGRSGSEHWHDVIGPGNSTLVYTGEIYLDDATTFVESIDDKTRLIIDGTTVLDNTNWQDTTHGTLTRAAGWYDIDLRFSNGHGGYGPVKKDGWTADFGFGMDPLGRDDEVEEHFVFPVDPGDASLFRVGIPASPSDLIKTGSGTLTLEGDNTYIGITDIQDGTLLVNGTTSGQGDYIVHPGATLGGEGIIGLAPGARIDVRDGGILGPGTSPGTLGVEGTIFMDGTYAWELTAGGSDLVEGVGLADTLNLDGWVLQILDGDVDSYAWMNHLLFTGFDTIQGPNAFRIDTSGLPRWRQFPELSDPTIFIDDGDVYLTGLTTVPEPATLALFALGGLGLLRRRRKK
ncbi:MAG: autotransporter-associated beta strand repeat-containing protein [Candidatus Brocadiia bacterium]